jgi:hypothetical protein
MNAFWSFFFYLVEFLGFLLGVIPVQLHVKSEPRVQSSRLEMYLIGWTLKGGFAIYVPLRRASQRLSLVFFFFFALACGVDRS